MAKVLSINRYTGIDHRSSIGTPDHPVVNQAAAPTIAELHRVFLTDGVPLAVQASRKALAEAGIADPAAITHLVATTCTDSANPGYDHFVAKALGLSPRLEKVLLHGVGCSGGLAALRTAANLCLGHAARGLPARALVVALEVSTTLVRSELDSVHARQETRIGVALFSDGASAVVLSNGRGPAAAAEEPVYDLLGWEHRVVPDTEDDLGFDVDPAGWKVVLSPRVPKLTEAVVRPAWEALMAALPAVALPAADGAREPSVFDWAMHPGGATILTGAERALGITPAHMRASYAIYVGHGNSSSATIFSVLDRLRAEDMDALAPGGRARAHVVGAAFGPGIAVEMCMLRRNLHRGRVGAVPAGLQTPPETESDVSSSRGDEGGGDEGGEATAAGSREHVFVSEALDRLELD